MLQPPLLSGPSPLRSCNVNRLRALQEVVGLLIGRIPAVCRSVLSSGRPCGSSLQRKRERCGGMRANDCPATAAPLRPTLSAHHPQTKCSCVTSSQRGSRRDLQESSFVLAACLQVHSGQIHIFHTKELLGMSALNLSVMYKGIFYLFVLSVWGPARHF